MAYFKVNYSLDINHQDKERINFLQLFSVIILQQILLNLPFCGSHYDLFKTH
jgi:hypothetical protein